jgi:hypothetical protein
VSKKKHNKATSSHHSAHHNNTMNATPSPIDVEADCSITRIIDSSYESTNDNNDDSYLLPDFMPPALVIMNRPAWEKSSFAIDACIFQNEA